MHSFLVLTILFANLATNAFGQQWPKATSEETVDATIKVSGGVKDFGFKRLTASSALGSGDQSEGQKALIRAEKNAVIKNLIIGQNGADGIHCYDGCTLQNVWWEKVGEDAATFRSSSGCKEYSFTVTGGGVKNAKDKVFQMNGGGTLTIKNFVAEGIGKLARACGNCKTQCQKRKFVLENIKVTGLKTLLCGLNENYGDVATIKNVQITGSKKVCAEFQGNNQQKEPPMLRSFDVGSKGDGKNCIISGTTSG
uniref:Probable pectate lyase F n=1 Tax=Heterodera glycines TaxID=51029 RepID=H6SWR3_HETGL|nr:pectate lyase [Heterodera glycines]